MPNRFPFPLTVALAIALATLSCAHDTAATTPAAPPPTAVRAVPAVTADVPLEITAIGNVEAVSTVDVKARITAPILRVNFTEGQDVRQGDLLFELDP